MNEEKNEIQEFLSTIVEKTVSIKALKEFLITSILNPLDKVYDEMLELEDSKRKTFISMMKLLETLHDIEEEIKEVISNIEKIE